MDTSLKFTRFGLLPLAFLCLLLMVCPQLAYGIPLNPDLLRRDAIVEAVAASKDSVVAIQITQRNTDPFAWMSGQSELSSEGSGVIIQQKPVVVLTNAHVVKGAQRIQIQLSDNQTDTATIVGMAPEVDLAVLQLDTLSKATPIRLGNSDDLLLGESVLAIGNPLGLGMTVTRGVISAVNRPIEIEPLIYQSFIQTDASINPGNSGGALINVLGELIGINTAIRADAEGIGFAIPINRAQKIATDLLNFGEVIFPWLAVDLNDVLVRNGRYQQLAPQVSYVYPMPSETGLLKGDVIVGVNAKTIQSLDDLNAYLSTLPPEGLIQLTVLRQGKEIVLKFNASPPPHHISKDIIDELLGARLAQRSGAVYIQDLFTNGALAQNRLRPGDVILAVNGVRLRDLDELHELLRREKSHHRGSAVFTIRRGGAQGDIRLPI